MRTSDGSYSFGVNTSSDEPLGGIGTMDTDAPGRHGLDEGRAAAGRPSLAEAGGWSDGAVRWPGERRDR